MVTQLAPCCYVIQSRVQVFTCMKHHLESRHFSSQARNIQARMRSIRAWSYDAQKVPKNGRCVITFIDKVTSGLEDALVVTDLE